VLVLAVRGDVFEGTREIKKEPFDVEVVFLEDLVG
jgi:hypothetical protein